MSKTSKILILFIILGITFWIIWLKAEAKDKLSSIETEQPQFATIVNNRLISGVLLPAKEITIKSQLSGILEELYVKIGDKISIGDKIAKIKLVADPNSVEIAKKNLNTAKIRFENEEKNYQRTLALYEKNFISEADLENAQRTYSISKEEFLSAENQLQIIREGFSSKQKEVSNIVKATSSGTILALPLKEGSSVIERNNFNEGSTIALIADLDFLIFKGKVNESDIMFLREGQVFEISIPALKDIKTNAKLSGISPKGTEQNGMMKFDIEANVQIPQETKLIRSGFTAIANIILHKKENVLSIQERNLQFENDSCFVEIINNNFNTRKQYVETGLSDGLRIEIKEGLTENNKIKVI